MHKTAKSSKVLLALALTSAILTLAVAARACSPDQEQEMAPNERIKSAQARDSRELRETYRDELEQSPEYTSRIRSELIAQADQYRQTYRPFIDEFRGLEESFKCPYPPDAITRAEADGWELVKCTISSAVFFRRLDQPQRCQSMKAIAEEFETLQLFFEVDGQHDLARPERNMRKIFGRDIPPPSPYQTGNDMKRSLVGSDDHQGLEFRRSEVQGLYANYIIDFEGGHFVIFFEKKRPQNCARNSYAVIASNGAKASLDTPDMNYESLQRRLEAAIRYAGGQK